MGFPRWKFEFQPKISCKPIRISLAHKFLNQTTDFVGLHRNRPCISARSTTLAPPVGLEPTTYRLTADRSTIELWRIIAYSSAIGVKFQLAPQVGLEPTTFRLTAERSAIELLRNIGCGKDVSYLPRFLFFESGDDLLSRAVSSQVPSACGGLTSVFGMGTGGTLQLLSPEIVCIFLFPHLQNRTGRWEFHSRRSLDPAICFLFSQLTPFSVSLP